MTQGRLFLRKVKTGEEYVLAGVMPVGREVAEGIKLVDEGVSRRHATLSVVDGTVYLEDAGSRNGTYVNADPLTGKTVLKSGDRVRFDTEEFEFRVEGATANATVVHRPSAPNPTAAPAPTAAATPVSPPRPSAPAPPAAAAPVSPPRPSTPAPPAAAAPVNAPRPSAPAPPATAAPVSTPRPSAPAPPPTAAPVSTPRPSAPAPPPTAAPVSTPRPSAPAAAAAPSAPRSGAERARPGSWAEVEFNSKGTDGTERFDAKQLQDYLAKAKVRQERQAQLDTKEPCLTFISGNQTNRVLSLAVDAALTQEWTIGRSADSAIRMDEPGVSDRHAKIVREGARWKLVDAISSNGSFVNDLQVGMCYLAGGDSLRFGRVECTFNLPRKAAVGAIKAARAGAGGGSKKVILIGVTVSFLITLAILYWVFRSRFS